MIALTVNNCGGILQVGNRGFFGFTFAALVGATILMTQAVVFSTCGPRCGLSLSALLRIMFLLQVLTRITCPLAEHCVFGGGKGGSFNGVFLKEIFRKQLLNNTFSLEQR